MFFDKDDKLLEKYNEIWDKFSYTIGKEFDSNPVYNKKYLRAKIKSYNGKTNTNFHNNELPKEVAQFACLQVISIDSSFRTGEKYHPQVFLEECKYIIKERRIHNYITDDLEIFSDSDEEILGKIQIKKDSDEKRF